ncbi:DUF4397 domain-containing protein [Neobacillus sp. LXY-4]|uniref:DUF4397 domain-containing protein n=1 Tax=Neobacillus sp. LXY-4 TaxID=3379826 RepID=UPI003EDEB132
MSEKRNGQDYFEKASAYDMMANYYKYLDPNMHIHYYKKHLQALTKAFQLSRLEQRPVTQSNQPNGAIRFLHVSTDAPNVDVYINAIRVFKNISYKDVSNYLSLPTGKYHVDIYPAENSVSSILNKRITVEAGKIYTLPIIGTEKKLRMLSVVDHLDVPTGETKVRFLHLSQNTPAVDLAVVKGDVVFPQVAYRNVTPYLGLTPMNVKLEMREAGTKQVILPLPNMQFKENEVYTIVAAGLQQGEPLLEAFIIRG